MEEYQILTESFHSIKDRIPFIPDLALVLGSGLGNFPVGRNEYGSIPYNEAKNFPVLTVEGHNGRFVFLKIGGKNVVCMEGRVHMYEGYSAKEVVRL